jgi:TatD DNase family protein
VIDTHAHLDACEEPASVLAERAASAGVNRIVAIGTGIDSCVATLAIAAGTRGVYAACGIDPHRAASAEAGRVAELRPLLVSPGAVAVGETGLDGHYGRETLSEQRELFDAQLELARELELPVVVHSRQADTETVAALAQFDGTVVLHCFSEPGLLGAALERGYYVSFAGNVTYPNAHALREAALRVPPDRVLAETDSPYLAPQPRRGSRNEPANVMLTLDVLAAARGVGPGELEAQIDANASAAFRLP